MATTFSAKTVIKSAEINANFLEMRPRTFRTQATAAGTTTLVFSDAYYQNFTGVTTQTCVMPVATTMVAGYGFEIINISTGIVTLNSSGAVLLQSMAAGSKVEIICKDAAGGTGSASWQVTYIPNFISGNIMSAGGDLIYGGTGGAPARLGNGSAGQFLKSAGGTAAPVWSAASFGDVQTKTTTYPIVITDGYINCSASAFTTTLPTAVGNSGKIFVITKTDSSLTNIITIATTSAQTIDGVTTTTLNTQYEAVAVISDGANWSILSRKIPRTWTSYSATITGTSVAGTMTYTANTLYWCREGDSVHITGNIRLATVTTAPTGSTYINLPSGIVQATVASSSDGGRGAWGVTCCDIASVATSVNWLTIGSPSTDKICFSPGRAATPALVAASEVKVNFVMPVSGWNS